MFVGRKLRPAPIRLRPTSPVFGRGGALIGRGRSPCPTGLELREIKIDASVLLRRAQVREGSSASHTAVYEVLRRRCVAHIIRSERRDLLVVIRRQAKSGDGIAEDDTKRDINNVIGQLTAAELAAGS